MKKILAILLLLPSLVFASEAGFPLERAPDRSGDLAALQNGAKLFVNYCLNCHGAALMRYNRMNDIGLTDEQIKQNLMFTADKVGDLMKTAMAAKDAKEWFGGVPPDLSVIARAKSSGQGSGADYLYTYLRTYYRDETRSTGWNNLVYPNVGMPHVLWELQGQRAAMFIEVKDPHDPSKTIHQFDKFEQITPGLMKPAEFDAAIADLVGFMHYMSEPVKNTRVRLGVVVLLFLAVFTVAAWRLNAAYWKDIK
jgi:ubiquinol-cytochrome c reductase cytochrome c1 subunit